MEQKVKSGLAEKIRSIVLNRFLVKVIINGLAVIVLIFSLLYASSANLLLTIGFMVLVFVVTLFRSYRQKKEQLSDGMIFRNFDREFSEMENSSHLLSMDYSELNDLERLQYDKINGLISAIIDKFQPRIRIKRAIYFLIFSLSVCTVVVMYSAFSKQNDSSQQSKTDNLVSESIPTEHQSIPVPSELAVSIISPLYTNINVKKYSIEDLEVVENSVLSFDARFTDHVNTVSLLLNEREIPFRSTESGFKLNVKISRPSIYQIVYSVQDSVIQASLLHQIKVNRDESPEIEVSGLESYQIVEEAFGDPVFNIKIKDDYGIDDGYIVATITKGEGESVKFREETIALDQKLNSNKNDYKGKQRIDLTELGMEPGDELYFYVHASDNRYPEANESRSQTFFIVMPDSARDVITMSAGIGVDLMPEYFRSQRQIIIDTEKLIAEKDKITKHEFDSRSNELGYDQKQLRLRYGQFMGEEFETEIGGTVSEADHDHEGENEVIDDESILEKYGHAHDTEDVADRGVLDTEDHDHDHGNEGGNEKGQDAESILEELAHNHDSEESATLFFESSKVKLRAALSLMWTSELHLRLSEPETALPVEYEILKLLKEVQQMSRIYVQRIGFDPPPIKEYEKRLTGDINEIKSYENIEEVSDRNSYEKTKEFIAYLDNLKRKDLSSFQIPSDNLKEVKTEISIAIQSDPLKYFSLIEVIQRIESGQSIGFKEILYIQRTLAEIIGSPMNFEVTPDGNLNPLNEIYLEEITNSTP